MNKESGKDIAIRLALFFTLVLFLTASQVLAQPLKWYKGNIHTHSYWSDGDDFPEMIMAWYKEKGYHFVCLSDHNVLAEGENWKQIPALPASKRGFDAYLKKYGDGWVNFKTDSAGHLHVKLKTLEEYRPLFEEPGKFLILQAEEITDQFERKPIHVNAINIRERILPQGGMSVADVMQNNINEVMEQRARTGVPMFPHINHPNFGWAITIDDLKQINGERFFEVYNGHPLVNNYGDSSRMGTEQMWDELLIDYIQKGKPLIYGLATDDAHHYLNYRIGQSNPGRGFIMVRSRELTPHALIEAMENGDFYSSTGVMLKKIEFKKDRLSLKVKPERGIDYTIQIFGANKATRTEEIETILLQQVKASKATYKLSKDHLYVRVRILSSKLKENPFQEGDFETAWTQPVMLLR